MKFKQIIDKIILFIKKDTSILFFIVLLAYILRILPYLLGYSIPFTEDGLRDFQQVKYILDNNSIDFFQSYQSYGAFPLLHLIMAYVSKLGFDPMKVYLFLPQILASFGLIFYYLFLKKYFTSRQSLLACFLIAVFIPHIHWSSQPVRETLGLFFFPLIVYLFDKVITENIIRFKYLVPLLLSFILLVPTHHWSAIMTLTWLLAFSLFFINRLKRFFLAVILIFFFLSLNIIYWYFLFPISFVLITSLFAHINITQLISTAILLIFIAFFRLINLDFLKTPDIKRNSFLILVILVWLIAKNILPLSYPLQIWAHFLFFLIFIYVGFFYTKDNFANKLLSVSIFYFFYILIVITFNTFQKVNIYSLPFDPLRTFEFAIFPLSILASLGLKKMSSKIKVSGPIIILILIIGATFTYPPIFIYGNSFINTPFYDIRSNIRYISPGEMELIKWANEHNYSVISNRPEIRSYQDTMYLPNEKKLYLMTLSDEILRQKYNYIHDPIIRVGIYPPKTINNNQIIYRNHDGWLINILYNAEFISFDIPDTLIIKGNASFVVKMKNTGDNSWLRGDGYVLRTTGDEIILDLNNDTPPGDIGVFTKTMTVPDVPGKYYDNFRIYSPGSGYFGDPTPSFEILLIK